MSLHVEITGNGPDLVLLHGWGLHQRYLGRGARRVGARFSGPCRGFAGLWRQSDMPALRSGKSGPGGGSESVPPASMLSAGLGRSGGAALGLDQPQQVQSLMLVGTSPCFVQRTGLAKWNRGENVGGLCERSGQDYVATLLRFLSLAGAQWRECAHGDEIPARGPVCPGRPSAEVLRAGLERTAGE